ncbi:NHL repeat-containing protein 3 isoform X1 [Phyllostomus discolor]|uniref:NHL repeat-containing protein 3 isoform X1 n=1 Tax=Phyllostomus discolor TaxID=89673 RepID=A0A7E6CLH3_9CHIR|nr:NHL repeat-containing protein 3 isoform X1 [Phyllostomus discolor]
MARVWLCAGGAGCLLVFLVLHSHLSGSPVLRDFVFQISWRTEDVLYRLDVGWPEHPEYFAGATFCVAVDSPNGLVYVAQRGDDVQKVLVFTEDGYFLRAWNHTVDTPHGMFAASTPQEPAVWITDVGSGPFGHTVKKYDSFGDLVQVLGTPGQSGAGLNPLQFDSPSELYVEDSGDIYVVDGDGGLNNRLIKLSQGVGRRPGKQASPGLRAGHRGLAGSLGRLLRGRGALLRQVHPRRAARGGGPAEPQPAAVPGRAPRGQHRLLLRAALHPAGRSGLAPPPGRQRAHRSHLRRGNRSETSAEVRPLEKLLPVLPFLTLVCLESFRAKAQILRLTVQVPKNNVQVQEFTSLFLPDLVSEKLFLCH